MSKDTASRGYVSIFVPAVLSDRNNSDSEFLTVAWQLHLNGLNSTFYFFN